MAAHTHLSLKFRPARRIKQGRDFVRIRHEGERAVAGCVIANWRRLTQGSTARLGVVTGSRIGNAARRSRARRLLREVFRLHQHDFAAPVDLVLVARPSIAGKPFADVERDVLSSLARNGLLKQTGTRGNIK